MFYTIDNFEIVENLNGVESLSILLKEDKSFTKVFQADFQRIKHCYHIYLDRHHKFHIRQVNRHKPFLVVYF